MCSYKHMYVQCNIFIHMLQTQMHTLQLTEVHLRDAQERVSSYEQRSLDQAKTIAELNARLDQTTSTIDEVRDKWHESTGENRSIMARVEVQEGRIRETEQQNRELMEMMGKKEEEVRRFQMRVEELLRDVASANSNHEVSKSEYKRQLEQIKDRAASKVCYSYVCIV